ncbi:hypothetical protein AA0116_g1510 [Alternaria tenuissima]|nr:hypothetical protein AA0116_g1510 [Alternaria tenuissima]
MQQNHEEHNRQLAVLVKGALEALGQRMLADCDIKTNLSTYIGAVDARQSEYDREKKVFEDRLTIASQKLNVTLTADASVADRLAAFISGVTSVIESKDVLIEGIQDSIRKSAQQLGIQLGADLSPADTATVFSNSAVSNLTQAQQLLSDLENAVQDMVTELCVTSSQPSGPGQVAEVVKHVRDATKSASDEYNDSLMNIDGAMTILSNRFNFQLPADPDVLVRLTALGTAIDTYFTNTKNRYGDMWGWMLSEAMGTMNEVTRGTDIPPRGAAHHVPAIDGSEFNVRLWAALERQRVTNAMDKHAATSTATKEEMLRCLQEWVERIYRTLYPYGRALPILRPSCGLNELDVWLRGIETKFSDNLIANNEQSLDVSKSRDNSLIRLRQCLYDFVSDVFKAANITTENWPETYADDDPVLATNAEKFAAERLEFFREAIKELDSEGEDIENFMVEGREAMNELVAQAHRDVAKWTPTRDKNGVWLAALKRMIQEIIDKNHAIAKATSKTLSSMIAAVDKIFQDLFDTNKVPRPAWEDTTMISPTACISFFSRLPTLLALGLVNHEINLLRQQEEILQLQSYRDNTIPEFIQFVRNVYEALKIDAGHWSPPTTTDTAVVFRGWLQGRQIEISSKWNSETKKHESEMTAALQALANLISSTSQLLPPAAPVTATGAATGLTIATCDDVGRASAIGLKDSLNKLKKDTNMQLQLLVDEIIELAYVACRCAGVVEPYCLFPPIDVWSTNDQLIQWRQTFEGWFNTTFEQNQAAFLQSREHDLHFQYGKLLSWQARKVYFCLLPIYMTLNPGQKWTVLDLGMTWSSLDINEQNTTDAIAWIECACRMLDQLAKERARNAMAVMDQLEHARRVAQDADDVIDTMERTIAEAKAVVTKQSDLIQQLRQASA